MRIFNFTTVKVGIKDRTEENTALTLVGHQWTVSIQQIPSVSPDVVVTPDKKQRTACCATNSKAGDEDGDS